MFFPRDKEVAQIAQPQVDIEVNGEKIPYNPTPRLLGVHLDETLSFSGHLSVLERKAEKTLSVLRQVSVTEKLSTKSLLCYIKP